MGGGSGAESEERRRIERKGSFGIKCEAEKWPIDCGTMGAENAESLFTQVTRQFEGKVCEPIILPSRPHGGLTGAR